MDADRPSPNMRIQLSSERRESIVEALRRLHADEFDEPISLYQAERVLELFMKRLGPAVYNQAIQDARGYVFEKLEDIEGEVYVPDDED